MKRWEVAVVGNSSVSTLSLRMQSLYGNDVGEYLSQETPAEVFRIEILTLRQFRKKKRGINRKSKCSIY